jgi:V8-like Glu-specific endopeptidase
MLSSKQPARSTKNETMPDSTPILFPKISPTQIFEDLAKSSSAFNSVGHIMTIKACPEERFVRYECLNGSGVYIGNQVAITAAHVVPLEVKNGEFISRLDAPTYFFVEGNDGVRQTARVMMAYRHPDYSMDNPASYKNFKNDIAILLLSHEFKNINSIELNDIQKNRQHDCTVVGYSDQMTPISSDNKRIAILNSDKFKKVGVKTHESYYNSALKLYVNQLGYSIASEHSFFGWFSFSISQKNSFDPLEAGTYRGMSGGGYFNNNTLIGIHVGSSIPRKQDNLSHALLDEDYFVPLFNNKDWIEAIITLYKIKLFSLMEKNKEWDRDHEKYTVSVGINLKEFGIFSSSESKSHPHREGRRVVKQQAVAEPAMAVVSAASSGWR